MLVEGGLGCLVVLLDGMGFLIFLGYCKELQGVGYGCHFPAYWTCRRRSTVRCAGFLGWCEVCKREGWVDGLKSLNDLCDAIDTGWELGRRAWGVWFVTVPA